MSELPGANLARDLSARFLAAVDEVLATAWPEAVEVEAPARPCPAEHGRLCDRLPHDEAAGCLVCPVTL